MSKETYYKRALDKHVDTFLEKCKQPPQNPDTRLIDAQSMFLYATIDCINELDARLKKLENVSISH